MPARELTIGQIAERSGLTISQIRFYEKKGLISPPRNRGGQRRFPRAELRRLAFIRAAQRLGLSLQRIAEALGPPSERPPTPAEWAAIAEGIRGELDDRIARLTRLRDRLDGCIGCGCLSMETCALYNPDDRLGGPGPALVEGRRAR
ncbi:redox-sensitive transcriptional activator SoxR [Jannaschia seohaensis]|uniref:MerR family redox-sensitive transcriptional activator SoxR n=1 Tax=Jannaschia seohaensis TaxID=475081 RepID=A0A2Y9A440_9RHOB|nr:redox-sensitive transcriptional activator SoxR [Jannaschia seohaensis]PWJ22368.1 MerR family redox-sensitive transcriptional activator SoxR [Jannaschia seohaensis]SSA38646.1 MerR family transcriptional regulator, redox-sensitive transcriptional activator SoxR [Jannaschia seohaensis]